MSNELIDSLPKYKIFEEKKNQVSQLVHRLLHSPQQVLTIKSKENDIEKKENLIEKEDSNLLCKLGICKPADKYYHSITWSYDYLRIYFLRNLTPRILPIKYTDIQPLTTNFLETLPYHLLREKLSPELYGKDNPEKIPKEIKISSSCVRSDC